MFVHQRSVLPLATIKGDRKFFTCPSLSIVAAGPPAYPAGGILLGLASHRDSRLGDLDLNVEVSAARLPHSCELLESGRIGPEAFPYAQTSQSVRAQAGSERARSGRNERRSIGIHLLREPTRTRGRCFRKPAKCSRIRVATSFAAWCLVLTGFIANVFRTVSSARSAPREGGVSVGSAAAGSSGEVVGAVLASDCGNSSSAIHDAPTKWPAKETCPIVLPLSSSKRLPVLGCSYNVCCLTNQMLRCPRYSQFSGYYSFY
jgi:hypothetical protein